MIYAIRTFKLICCVGSHALHKNGSYHRSVGFSKSGRPRGVQRPQVAASLNDLVCFLPAPRCAR
jgi:hypothetical protein